MKTIFKWNYTLLLITGLALLAPTVSAQQDSSNGTEELILTSLPVTFFLASSLLADTAINVRNLPPRGRRLNGQANYFESRAESLAETFNAAIAVITIGKLWRDDPIFTAVRGSNIRVVEIDATKPWSSTLEGVSIAMSPRQDASWMPNSTVNAVSAATPSLFFWLSLANANRSADIIARDLMRLLPDEASQIQVNLTTLRRKLLDLQHRYEIAFLEVPDVTVFSLASELVYLTSDLGLFVDGSFYKQDIYWTEDDLVGLSNHLRNNQVAVVLHKWEPAEPILNAIESAGASLVVVETLDSGIVESGNMLAESYFLMMEANLENIRAALAATSRN
ncbi:MAG: hypothetical protein COA96_00715 [SAR86 cluster bacterium]|uniref:Metal ion ABC transporter substrate-binding protein n=1 Tax=SAR86 cluster bacterium TaxID=2030880 RepID=A0A2A5BB08_9GAMM|nr:MAG: hypothetical protein COA96_00715 [SAR86 cluster bacterium]